MHLSIDDKKSACDQRNIEMDYLHLGFDISMIAQLWIYCKFYYYIDWSNGNLIVWWLFENRYFVANTGW